MLQKLRFNLSFGNINLMRNKVAKCTLGTLHKLERPGIPKFLVKPVTNLPKALGNIIIQTENVKTRENLCP